MLAGVNASRRSFLGVPVEGDVRPGVPRPVQRPLSDLEPVLRAILDDDDILSFGWTQYTPYYNDGERCVFDVDEPWFRTTADPHLDDEVDEDFSISIHPTLAGTPDRRRRCQALADAFETGEFDDVLLDAFGDHARVQVSRSGIILAKYEHD
jgi:hypothetical protein